MVSPTPPQGISETDYEAIEAAVTETVRGRWFLNEFARRNRTAEMRQLLDAMARIESTVASSQTALASADPSIRLMMQRIKDIAGQLDGLSRDMREAGVDERFSAAADLQARAVAGLMRNGTAKAMPPRTTASLPPAVEAATSGGSVAALPGTPLALETTPVEPIASVAQAPAALDAPALPTGPAVPDAPGVSPTPVLHPSAASASPRADHPPTLADARRQALSGLDGLTLSEKLALFT